MPDRPRDPESLLRIFSYDGPSNTLRWLSIAGRSYSVERSFNLESGFVSVQQGIAATPGTNAFVDPAPLPGATVYYRVKLD